jgi:hypothetical protein
MRPHDWLPALLTAFWATCTFACTVPQDLRPYSQRLADAPLAFIGTVTSVSGLRVTFAVHHAINGAPGLVNHRRGTDAVHLLHRLRRWPAVALCGTGHEPAVGPSPCQRTQLRRRTTSAGFAAPMTPERSFQQPGRLARSMLSASPSRSGVSGPRPTRPMSQPLVLSP